MTVMLIWHLNIWTFAYFENIYVDIACCVMESIESIYMQNITLACLKDKMCYQTCCFLQLLSATLAISMVLEWSIW